MMQMYVLPEDTEGDKSEIYIRSGQLWLLIIQQNMMKYGTPSIAS